MLLVLGLADPVARGVSSLLSRRPLKTLGDVELGRWGDAYVAAAPAEPTQLDATEVARRLGEAHLVYVSRHSMADPRPMVTAHCPGPWEGRPALCDAHLLSTAFRLLCRAQADLLPDFQCALEATHHGPPADLPTVFLELGGGPEQWRLRRGWEALLQALQELAARGPERLGEPAISIGDLHYSTLADRVLRGEVALGHSLPKYVRPISQAAVGAALERTVPRPRTAFLSWKAYKAEERHAILAALRDIEVVKRGA